MENEKKVALTLVRKNSGKKGAEDYFSLVLDYGYRKQILIPFDSAVIISVLDCPMSTLYDLCKKVDDECVVAYLDFNVDDVE